ncbi:serine/threonine-protein kinase [Streptomyces sp. NBC_01750]|uniref:serine/threonine-protein kinase n=1 Tax=Streptomyces sp. NBC_01750 TaxID=2975928 RepID=UPI002DD9F1B8|nr:serine/threonine-protein kinase [Streptomyces sp. NBC_01750]WSD34636.1 serine/threonine protein kinase [Streptomyces sp. NBC_01750]
MQPLDPGDPRSIGAYRLLGRLGAGGMGRVYLGRSAGGRTVAVKVVHPHFALDEEFRARFRREVEAARRVGGKWTAPVLDADPEASVPWVATGYVAGPALSQAVSSHGPLPVPAVRVLGAGLAEALAAVHALELVHRDVKPSNVLLTLDGPRLIDFGIARATDGTASLTSTGVSVGSPGYMSPEQILGKGVTAAADVFSLGAVLAYAATGEAPFPGDSSAALLYKVVHEEPELGSLEGDLRELVADCLAKNPAARPAPAEIASRLAPGGAAGLVGAGWLPGPLVEQVSRAAVTLLNLEPAPDPVVSGPVAFSSPAVGVFGPPVEPPRDAPPTTQGASNARLSVSVTADSVPTKSGAPGERGGRKVSCTVALAVAGALAAVTFGGAVLFDLLPGRNDKGSDTAARPPAGSPSAEPSDGSAAEPTEPGEPGEPAKEVPKAFIGAWKGPFDVELAGSKISAGTFRVVIGTGKAGAKIGTVNQFDVLGNFACEDNLVLRSATATELVADGKSSGKAGNNCTPGTHTVKLRLTGARLQYTSQEPRAGDPRALLDRER